MKFAAQLAALLAFAIAGFGLGLLHFRGLWCNVRQFADGGRALALVCLAIGRFLLLVTGLLVISLTGALPLLAAALGVIAARAAALRHVRGLIP